MAGMRVKFTLIPAIMPAIIPLFPMNRGLQRFYESMRVKVRTKLI